MSLTIELEMPWSHTTSFEKIIAIDLAVKGCLRHMKCAYLESLSITTNMQSNPWDRGSLVIKSMEMSSHTAPEIGRG